MKKTTILLIFISMFYLITTNSLIKAIEIPDDAIRIRIIPNSNSNYDQSIKTKVKEKLQIEMYEMLKDTKTTKQAKNKIKNNLEKIDKNIETTLKHQNYNKEYKINFGYNYFPEKEYKGIKYKEGFYESLLVTLGEGKGDNWWCILFPPLCLIESENTKETEYKSLVKEIIDKFYNKNKGI